MTKYFIDSSGAYLGGYVGATPPEGSIEVKTPPSSGFDLWSGSKWVSPPTPIPQSVTMRQARLALLGAGKLAGVTAAINALPSPQKEAAQIEWEYAAVVHRSSGLVPMLGAALGMTKAQLDDLFVAALAL